MPLRSPTTVVAGFLPHNIMLGTNTTPVVRLATGAQSCARLVPVPLPAKTHRDADIANESGLKFGLDEI